MLQDRYDSTIPLVQNMELSELRAVRSHLTINQLQSSMSALFKTVNGFLQKSMNYSSKDHSDTVL